jgi:lipopolysaccharide transport protein LptA
MPGNILRALLYPLALLLLLSSSAGAAAEGDSASGDSSAKTESASIKGFLTPGAGDKKAPVYIKSDSLSLDSKARVFTYKGNVEIRRSDLTITADTVVGKYDEKNELQIVVCQGNVVVTRGETLRTIANKAVYRVSAATIVLTESPELMREGNILAADRITVYVDEDRSEADGNVRVKVVNAEDAGKSKSKNLFETGDAESSETDAVEE